MAHYRAAKKGVVFKAGEAPFAMCHASNCCLLPNGDVVVAWFAGSKEGADDTAIWMSRLPKEGKWQPIRIVANDEGQPHWNPVFHFGQEGQLMLFYKVGRDIHSWSTRVRFSNDGGETWSEPRELVQDGQGGRGPVRTKLLSLSDGTLLAGGSSEQGIWDCFTDRSSDGGKTWVKSEPIAIAGLVYHGEKTAESRIEVSEQSFFGRGIIQPTLWESERGHVHMLMRSSEGKLYRADSADYGKTWSSPKPTALENNNSGIDVVKLSSGTLILCFNPVGINWGPRTPICLAASRDNGQTWKQIMTLEKSEGEYSYPSISRAGNAVCVSYTSNRKTIAFWQFDESELEG